MKRAVILLLKWLLYPISKVYIRQKNLWVFGSRKGQFVDNPKYFFLYMANNHKEISPVWITSDKKVLKELTALNYTVFHQWSIRGVLTSLKAAVYIYAFDSDDINFFCSGGAKLINLYHGIPLKKIEFDTTVGNSRRVYHPKNLYEKILTKVRSTPKWQKIDLFQLPSLSLKTIHDNAFNHLIKNYFIGVNPRLITLTAETNFHQLILNDKNKAEKIAHGYSQTWIYMPTWRVGQPDILAEAFPNIELLNNTLKKHNILLIFKMHLYSGDVIKDCTHIKLFPTELDVYPFLSIVDVLITDYSSIAFDFALTQKPIIFYPYDLKHYLATSSDGFYFKYKEFTNGKSVDSFEQLLHLIDIQKLDGFHLGQEITNGLWGDFNKISVKKDNDKMFNKIKELL